MYTFKKFKFYFKTCQIKYLTGMKRKLNFTLARFQFALSLEYYTLSPAGHFVLNIFSDQSLISKQDTFVLKIPPTPSFSTSIIPSLISPIASSICLQQNHGLDYRCQERNGTSERITLVFAFGGLAGFVMRNRQNRYSLFHSGAGQGELRRSELLLTPNVCETRSKALIPFDGAAAQLRRQYAVREVKQLSFASG